MLVNVFHVSPALTRWAKVCRAYGAPGERASRESFVPPLAARGELGKPTLRNDWAELARGEELERLEAAKEFGAG